MVGSSLQQQRFRRFVGGQLQGLLGPIGAEPDLAACSAVLGIRTGQICVLHEGTHVIEGPTVEELAGQDK